jgi:hypothetical protein
MSHVPESALSNPSSQDQEQTRSLISLETNIKHANVTTTNELVAAVANERDPSAAVPGTPAAAAAATTTSHVTN